MFRSSDANTKKLATPQMWRLFLTVDKWTAVRIVQHYYGAKAGWDGDCSAASRGGYHELSVWIRRGAPQNGGGAHGKEYWEALSALRREVEALAGEGIILRDPESGLVDFPARREGRRVFLCWRVGEDSVGFWHGPETGFSGRRPL